MISEASVSGLLAGLGIFLVFIVLIVIAIAVVQIIATWKVFQKAGKEGWEAIIPFYNTWVTCEIAGVEWWFFLLISATGIVSLLGLAFLEPIAIIASLAGNFACHYNLAIRFEKDPIGYGIGLTLLPIVFYCILGFGPAKYTKKEVSAYGPIKDNKAGSPAPDTTTSTNAKKEESKAKFCKNCGAPLTGEKFCGNCGKEVH